jgi:RecA/RadA recombinase
LKKPKEKEPVSKKEKEPIDKPSNRSNLISLYSKNLDAMEKQTRLVSNSMKYLNPLSSGNLCVDMIFGGGIFNQMMVIDGMSGAGKSTLSNHFIASAIKNELAFAVFFDAEGSLNPDLASSIFSQYGVDLDMLKDGSDDKSSPWRYYRNNVIETMFDFMHGFFKRMPDKVWVPDAESWAYSFPKRDDYAKRAMDIYGVKPDKSLTTDHYYTCLTDFAELEGAFFIDSFAAMVTKTDDEAEEKSRIRAAEAQAFSSQLKRVISTLSDKGVCFYGTNQLRKIPGQTYGSPYYAPGGEAIPFYASQRGRVMTRTSGYPGSMAKADKEVSGKFYEPSLLYEDSKDLYTYKEIKVAKNKPSIQGSKSWLRTWEDDGSGKGQGFDPFYDVFVYLGQTQQLKRNGRDWKFDLKDSVGKKRASMLNSIQKFDEQTLKALVLGEAVNRKDLTKAALEALNIASNPRLREALFNQLKLEPKIGSVAKLNPKDKDKEDNSSSDED